MRTGSHLNALFKGRHREEFAWFSILDSLPVLSMNADSAARSIVAACKRGDAELILTLPAKLAVLLHAMLPGAMADLFAWANEYLPDPGGVGTRNVKGRDSRSDLSSSWLTRLSDQAAARNNENS
jgi:hypothetical protein